MVPANLRRWFVFHFVVDVVIAIPLLLFPEAVLTQLGWESVDPFASRLVGAALMGIGVESYLGRNAGVEVFRGMLNLKIIWSLSAIFGIGITMVSDGPDMGWAFLGIFLIFALVWIYYRFRVRVEGIQ
jgi:hypothetical protein